MGYGNKHRTPAPTGFPKTGGFHRSHVLKHDGETYDLMIWSAPAAGYWIVCKKKDITVHRMEYEATWTAFLKELDPEIEAVKFDKNYMAPPVFKPTRPRDLKKLFSKSR